VYVRFFDEVKLGQALAAIDSLGIQAEDRSRLLFGQRLLVHANSNRSRAGWHPCGQIHQGSACPPKEDNAVAAQLCQVDSVQAAPFNLDGTGVVMGIWDGGEVRADHLDLTPRVTVVDIGHGLNDHSTHVAGTMIGSGANDANARGMAPNGGQLYSYDFYGDVITEQSDAGGHLWHPYHQQLVREWRRVGCGRPDWPQRLVRPV